MSRLTAADTYNLMEAYQQVYIPQELTEEQVWEEVEDWVNSLVEEGYDLSEYTWEDMYEEYLNEMGQPGANRPGQQSTTRGSVTTYAQPRANTGQPYQSRFARPMNAGTPQTYGGGRVQSVTVRPPVASLPSSARQVTQYPQGVSTGVGGGNAGASRQAPAARPAAPAAARPAAPAAARPAAPAPTAARPAAPAPTAARPAAPAATTGNPPLRPPALPPITGKPSLASQKSDIGDMIKKSQARQASMLNQSFDPFDVVIGHLIDEGYADTEEAALQIMANMSEEWRESIVEGEEKKEEESKKPFTGEGPKKPKGWKPTGPKLKSGQRPSWHR